MDIKLDIKAEYTPAVALSNYVGDSIDIIS